MRKTLLFLVLVIGVAAGTAAQMSGELAGWAEGPAGFLLTEGERTAWEGIATDEDAHSFIELFWARRDPDLATRANEFRRQFDDRVEAADAEFSEADLRGALTPRGKTLILLGGPAEHARMPIGDYLADLYRTGRPPQARSSDREAHIQMQGVSFKLHQGKADLWAYRADQLPPGIEWTHRENMVGFAFFDHEGSGQYRLQLGIRRAAESNAVLRAAPDALLLHPDMQQLPVFGLLPGIPAASEADLSLLESAPQLEGTVSVLESGAAGNGRATGWLSVRLPQGAPAADTMIGRLSTGEEVLGTFRMAVEPTPGSLGATVEMDVPAPASPAALEMVLVGSGEAIHAERLAVDLGAAEDPFMTPVFAGAEVAQHPDANVGEPFVFGGYHLKHRPDGRYRQGENLAVFCLLTASGAGEEQVRPGTVRMRWYIDGKATPNKPAQAIQFAPTGSGTWVWGTQLPLDALGADHEYELKVSVKDTVSGTSRTTRLPILILAE